MHLFKILFIKHAGHQRLPQDFELQNLDGKGRSITKDSVRSDCLLSNPTPNLSQAQNTYYQSTALSVNYSKSMRFSM
jgi:hypothetical protein